MKYTYHYIYAVVIWGSADIINYWATEEAANIECEKFNKAWGVLDGEKGVYYVKPIKVLKKIPEMNIIWSWMVVVTITFLLLTILLTLFNYITLK